MLRSLVLILLLLLSVGAYAQAVPAGLDLSNYGVRIEPDKRLLVVLAALEMAQNENPSGEPEKLIRTPLSEKGARFREQLQRDFADLPEDLRRKISVFVAQHKRRNARLSDGEIVAPFVGMAYTLSPIPDLADPVVTSDLPGSLLDVLDFAPLAREFYRRSGISSKLDAYSREYLADADSGLRSSAREMVSELLEYLHTRPDLIVTERIKTEAQKGKSGRTTIQKTETREHERRFIVVPEKLAPKGNVTFLNIRDDYYVIVPPDTELNLSDARRAFLQFVIDPLVLKQSREIAPLREWAKPLLDERRKKDPALSPDVFLAVSRSLVAAIDVRQTEYSQIRAATLQARRKIDQAKTESEKLSVSGELKRTTQALSDEAALRLYEDQEKGAILSFFFAEQLKGLEESGFDIASSLKEMLASFDPSREAARHDLTSEARSRALAARQARKAGTDTGLPAAVESPVTRRLLDIQKSIDAKDYSRANAELKKALVDFPSEPRVHYTIGRVASLDAATIDDPEIQAQKLLDAKAAFSNVLSAATATTDKALLSLTYVALGRIYEHLDDDSYAIKLYDKAIELSDVTGGAYRDAIAAKQRLVKPQ